jgi:hypothetical protein
VPSPVGQPECYGGEEDQKQHSYDCKEWLEVNLGHDCLL